MGVNAVFVEEIMNLYEVSTFRTLEGLCGGKVFILHKNICFWATDNNVKEIFLEYKSYAVGAGSGFLNGLFNRAVEYLHLEMAKVIHDLMPQGISYEARIGLLKELCAVVRHPKRFDEDLRLAMECYLLKCGHNRIKWDKSTIKTLARTALDYDHFALGFFLVNEIGSSKNLDPIEYGLNLIHPNNRALSGSCVEYLLNADYDEKYLRADLSDLLGKFYGDYEIAEAIIKRLVSRGKDITLGKDQLEEIRRAHDARMKKGLKVDDSMKAILGSK